MDATFQTRQRVRHLGTVNISEAVAFQDVFFPLTVQLTCRNSRTFSS